MRIGIDNISPGESTGLKAPGGMRIYLQSLLREFAIQRPKDKFVVFTPCWADPLFETIPGNIEIVKLPGVPINKALRVLYQQTIYPLYINKHRFDAFFATATITPLSILSPVVLSVQFIQFYKMPQAYKFLRKAYLRLMLLLSIRKAKKVIIFTRQSKNDLIQYTGAPPGKVFVIPHSLSEEIIKNSRLPDGSVERGDGFKFTGGRPYILYVSSTYGYKNHILLVKAFSLLKKRQVWPHVLLLVGDEIDVPFERIRAIAKEFNVLDDVILTGRLEHRVTAAIYLSADLAVFPSTYETFGYPVLEAMACRCPVVSSNTGIGAEAEDAAVMVDPINEHSIAAGMEKVLTDNDLRKKLIVKGQQLASNFTWEITARRTLEVLEVAGQQ